MSYTTGSVYSSSVESVELCSIVPRCSLVFQSVLFVFHECCDSLIFYCVFASSVYVHLTSPTYAGFVNKISQVKYLSPILCRKLFPSSDSS